MIAKSIKLYAYCLANDPEILKIYQNSKIGISKDVDMVSG